MAKKKGKRKATLERRRRKAKKLARECGEYLREEYGASKVYLVGSAVFFERFHPRSDIDLLVKSLPDEKYFKALKGCWNLLPPAFEIDLIPWNDAPERLKKKSQEKGELV